MHSDSKEIREYARSITGTVREPLLALDEDLRVVSASKSFYRTFQLSPSEAENRLLYELGNGGWNIPQLRSVLQAVVSAKTTVEDFELRHRFEDIGERVMMVNARQISYQTGKSKLILLAIENAVPILDKYGKVTGGMIGWQDISQQRHDREMLQKRTAELEATVNSIPDGYIIFAPDRSILRANEMANKIIGFTKEEWNLSYEERIGLLQARTPKGELFPIEQMPSNRAFNGETVRNVEMKVFRGGRHYWLSMSAAPIVADDGRMLGVVMEFADITERKRIEEALKSERERLQRAFEIETVGVLFFDMESNFTDANDAFLRMIGCDRQTLVRGELRSDCVTLSEWMPRTWQAFEELKATGRFNPYEKELIRPDGTRWWGLFSGARLNENEAVEFVLDITERKLAENALRESEEKFRATFEQAAVGMGRVSFHDAKWIDVNTAFCRMLGYSVEEFRATPWPRITHPDDVDLDLIPFRKMAAGELDSYSVEKRFIHKEGHYVWARLTLSLVRDQQGRPDYEIAIIENISERKQAQEALRESEERFRALVMAGSSAVFRASPDWSEMRQLTGRGFVSDTVKPTRNWLNDYIPPTDQSRVIEAIKEAMRIKRVYEIEHRVYQIDGSIGWALSRAVPLLDENGNIYEWFGSANDVTERKRAEEALQRRTEELAAANRDLESFTYSVSHDLRNPLRTIGGFTQFLEEDYSEKLDEEGRDFLRRIDGGVRKMQALIDDMLSLSRISRQEMYRKDIDLSATLREYIEELRRGEPGRTVEVVVQDNVHVDADPRLIHLALENLLRNAWKFTAKRETARIEFGTELRNGVTVYFVRDNGAGFDTQFAKQIFEPFRRVHGEKEFGGTGVGLSIVQRVIARHGGEVWAEGEVGKGAAFYFTIPRVETPR